MSIKQDKFGVFWYNQDEICVWGDAEFEAKAAEFKAAGINIVMTFSCTHFRWSYYPWRHNINAALARMVKACHKHNIRVVEHQSSHLTFAPHSQRDWDALKRKMVIRKGSIDMFPGLREHLGMGDCEIAPGVYLSDCRQIDGRTGLPAATGYNGYAHCFNNPHFRAAFFRTLEDVYATGIDGIMTDDVQYFGDGNACTCKYCREKFKSETNYDLPQPREWNTFYGNYSNPAFIAFLKFRVRSTENFQREVNRHFESLNLDLLRPNYVTSTFNRNITGYPFEKAADLWTHVFQENMFSSVIRTAWPGWYCDAMHRSSIARKYSIDSMSMFYPWRYDNYYFCWALSRAWEQLLMATPEGGDLNEVEQRFSAYEKLHKRLAGEADPMAEAAFLQPRSSLDYAPDSVESAMRPFHVWMQSAVFSNIRGTVLFEDDPLSEWQKYPCVVVAGATMLDDELLERMKQYAENGGKLLIFGKFGVYDNDCTERLHPEKIFNFTADLKELHPVKSAFWNWQGDTLELPAVDESYSLCNPAGDCRIVMQSSDGEILGVSAMNGNLLWLAGGIKARRPSAMHYGLVISKWGSNPDMELPAPDYAAGYLKAVPGRVLRSFIGSEPQISCNSEKYLAACYRDTTDSKYYLHIVNTDKILARPPEMVGHNYCFENFLKDAPANPEALEIKFRLPESLTKINSVMAYSPEFDGGKAVDFAIKGRIMQITVPGGTFAGYLHLLIF